MAASTVANSEVTALCHEARNDSVELAALVAERDAAGRGTCGSRCELGEVLCCLWHSIAVQAENDTTGIMAIDLEVEVNLLGDGLVSVSDCPVMRAMTSTMSAGESWHLGISLLFGQAIEHFIEVEGISNLIERVVACERVWNVPSLIATILIVLVAIRVLLAAIVVLDGGENWVLVAVRVVWLRAVGSLRLTLSACESLGWG